MRVCQNLRPLIWTPNSRALIPWTPTKEGHPMNRNRNSHMEVLGCCSCSSEQCCSKEARLQSRDSGSDPWPGTLQVFRGLVGAAYRYIGGIEGVFMGYIRPSNPDLDATWPFGEELFMNGRLGSQLRLLGLQQHRLHQFLSVRT